VIETLFDLTRFDQTPFDQKDRKYHLTDFFFVRSFERKLNLKRVICPKVFSKKGHSTESFLTDSVFSAKSHLNENKTVL
jgi:hypothetical protein